MPWLSIAYAKQVHKRPKSWYSHTMAKRKNKVEGAVLFDTYYSQIYQERWESLKQALLVEKQPIAFSENLVKPYYLDEASVIAAAALGVESNERVLDMCAAPGGKTLVLASFLKEGGTLVSNDRSADRRRRLKLVIAQHLKEDVQQRITVTAHDATRWSLHETEAYDRILLDAPCSSERHVLCDPKALSLWSAARPKHLAITQFAMLASALEAVKVGGHILYSTCSINPMENEAVIEKLFSRRKGRVACIPTDAKYGEQRRYGSIMMPDVDEGRGPLYFCHLRRLS